MRLSVVAEQTKDYVTEAIRDFLKTFSSPDFEKADVRHLIAGQSNDLGLPDDEHDFCVFYPISSVRRGTTIEDLESDGETMALHEYVVLTIQIDVYSLNRYRAQQRAQTYELISRSTVGCSFFKRYGLDLQFADDAQNLSGIDESDKWLYRWSLSFRLGLKKKVVLPVGSFDSVSTRADDIQNVDVKFPPKGKA